MPFRTYSPRLINVKTLHSSSLAVHEMERLKILSTRMTLTLLQKMYIYNIFVSTGLKLFFVKANMSSYYCKGMSL